MVIHRTPSVTKPIELTYDIFPCLEKGKPVFVASKISSRRPQGDVIQGIGAFNLSGFNSPPLGAYAFAVFFGLDTPPLVAGLFITNGARHSGCRVA